MSPQESLLRRFDNIAPQIIDAEFYETLRKEGVKDGLISIKRKLTNHEVEYIEEGLTYFASLTDPHILMRCIVYKETAKTLGCEVEVWVTEDLNTLLEYNWPHPYHRMVIKIISTDPKVTVDAFKSHSLHTFNALFPQIL